MACVKQITLRCFITYNSVVIIQQHNEIEKSQKTKQKKTKPLNNCFTFSKSEVLILVVLIHLLEIIIRMEMGTVAKKKREDRSAKKPMLTIWSSPQCNNLAVMALQMDKKIQKASISSTKIDVN